ncbi:hypothetical protein ANOM_002339 [Aspergillus nomiae NRRL 13137]|uniref:N-acetyltransferase domain-containing protein n=1 Tax=Aspergillus nomiae NRRL (strain ATCC 15546 / NRRL 13137 / CBS 260.88 / M93) TaxID=1509407 RepID=A0A0L1JD60_ASPN3|nr:uncharacterized protein ANOM_002339 [Aspergillus nomiae NRRL 13137]KNG89666.1 hypothetical protein ANOM_002339 [Aspergillus nomiae NRRL 13137]
MAPENWHRGDYLVSTDPDLLQVDAVNAALGSEMVWWAGDLPAAALQEALHSSLCFGLYQKTPIETSNGTKTSSTSNGVEQSSIDKTPATLKQIGLVRVITDNVTFAYLTDVYILDGHRGAGLGRWVLEILNEKLRSWPHLRRVMLLTTDKMHLFSRNLGMKDYREFDGMKGVSIAMVEGPGAQH